MKNAEVIFFSITIFVLCLAIIYLIITLSEQLTKEDLIYYCHDRGFNGTIELERYFYSVVNCSKMEKELFEEDGWTKECSTLSFSSEPSCHTLCNMDCEYENKKSNRICVC